MKKKRKTAKQILEEYSKSERNFRGLDISGESFKNENLEGANFEDTDLYGTDFFGANLTGANFESCVCGADKFKRWGLVVFLGFLFFLSGFLLAITGWWYTYFYYVEASQNNNYLPLLFVSVVIFLISIGAIQRRYVFAGITLFFAFLAVAATAFTGISGFLKVETSVGIAIALGTAGAGTLCAYFAASLINTIKVITNKAMVFIVFLVAGFAIVYWAGLSAKFVDDAATFVTSSYIKEIGASHKSMAFAAIGGLFSHIISMVISFKKDNRSDLLDRITVYIIAILGTNFEGATLEKASFSNADMTAANISKVKTIKHSLWNNTKNLNLAKLGNLILSNEKVRELLTHPEILDSAEEDKLQFNDLNFEGAYLRNLNLKKSNFKNSNLSDADLRECKLNKITFKNANLSGADLSDTILLGANLTNANVVDTNFTRSNMTGVCLENCSIEPSTIIDGVECRYFFQLEEENDDGSRERIPHGSENYHPGEFQQIHKKKLDTIRVVIRERIDYSAVEETVHVIKNNNPNLEVSVVEVTKIDIDKCELKLKVNYRNKDKFADIFLKTFESVTRKISPTAEDIKEIKQLISRRKAKVELSISNSASDDRSSYQIDIRVYLEENTKLHLEEDVKYANTPYFQGQIYLPISFNLSNNLDLWRETFLSLSLAENYQTYTVGAPSQREQVNSSSDIEQLRKKLKDHSISVDRSFAELLKHPDFVKLENNLRTSLNEQDTIHFVLQSDDTYIHLIPWHLWNFYTTYKECEIFYNFPNCGTLNRHRFSKKDERVRILSIVGDYKAQRLDFSHEKKCLQELPDANVTILEKVTKKKFHELLWDNDGWDVFCFLGHSMSWQNYDTGEIFLDDREKLEISKFEEALKEAIDNGLKLAILNSCDGIGIAKKLLSFGIQNVIVFKHLVPDDVAYTFFESFIRELSQGKSLAYSIRRARRKLEFLEDDKYPNATWLPSVYQNSHANAVSWNELKFR